MPSLCPAVLPTAPVPFVLAPGSTCLQTAQPQAYHHSCSSGNTGVQIEGKVNAITLDQCKRTGLLFSDVVSSCEVVNSQSIQVQCTNVVPTLAVDKSDGVQVSTTSSITDAMGMYGIQNLDAMSSRHKCHGRSQCAV